MDHTQAARNLAVSEFKLGGYEAMTPSVGVPTAEMVAEQVALLSEVGEDFPTLKGKAKMLAARWRSCRAGMGLN
jgi:hypothetical protein